MTKTVIHLPRQTCTIGQASELTGISRRRLRAMMTDGRLAGYVSDARKCFRPLVFSLFRHVMNCREEDALTFAAAISDRLGSNASPSLPASNGRGSSGPRSLPEYHEASSPRTCEGHGSENQERQPLRLQDGTTDRIPSARIVNGCVETEAYRGGLAYAQSKGIA